tara:strand:- start:3205 stop:4647 length:1443 start_codon:yes stop_codon:yes gene_type:complete
MSTEKSVKQIDKYLNDLDKSGDYPASFSEFIKELNTRIFIPIRIQKEDGEISAKDYKLSYLLALPGVGAIGFNYGDNILDYRQQLLEPESLDEYITALTAYLETEASETESTFGMPGPNEQNITYSSLANVDLISSISSTIFNWNEQDTDVRTYSIDEPKIQGLAPVTSKGTDPETGETRFGSNDYYSGPNVALNAANQYIDPRTGETKKLNGKVLSPHFRLGAATEVFSGLSQEAIFEIQQELSSLGLDIGSYNFVPGVVDPTLRGGEIDFIGQLMTEANDAIAMFPELNLVDRNANTILGQLRPYMEWKKGVDEQTNVFVESLQREFAADVVPPTEAEVKSAIDQLFIERGINPTANDYQKYATIFGNLQKDAAARAAEIEDNKLSLNDIIGLSTSYDNTTEIGPYTYGGFGISVPSAEEAREKLGKPLLQQIDVTTELGKIIDDLEAGRIDASQEILARTAAAQDFKRNFMVFEENF